MFHYGEMDCITRGQLYVPQYNLFGALHHNLVNGQDLIDDAQQCVEGWLDGVAPLNGSVLCKISCRTSASVTRRSRSLTRFSRRPSDSPFQPCRPPPTTLG